MNRLVAWRHSFTQWWQEPPHAAVTAIVTLFLLTAAGFFYIQHEGDVREEQFCGLILERLDDRAVQVKQTEQFLATPAGQQSSPLIDFVRNVSYPQAKADLQAQRDTVPNICHKYEE